MAVQFALAVAFGIGRSRPLETRLTMGYAAGFLPATTAGQARPRKTGAENLWRVTRLLSNRRLMANEAASSAVDELQTTSGPRLRQR